MRLSESMPSREEICSRDRQTGGSHAGETAVRASPRGAPPVGPPPPHP